MPALSPLALLFEAERHGCRFRLEGARAVPDAPERLPDGLRHALFTRRAELVPLLGAEAELRRTLGILRAREILEAALLGTARVDRSREPPVGCFTTPWGVRIWSALPSAVALAGMHERQQCRARAA